MAHEMRKKVLIVIIVGIVIVGLIVIATNKSSLIGLAFGAIASFLIYFMWSLPPKHGEFSDADRLEATGRALGGSGPPELWTPDMPHKKIPKRKHRKKK